MLSLLTMCMFVSCLLVDVNECTDEDLCSPFADCTNFDGSFNCSCIPGYAGNGSHCEGKPLYFISKLHSVYIT